MSTHHILFTADLHGNTKQYEKLFKEAYDKKIDTIIIGGDLLPKDAKSRTIQDQKKFISNTLFTTIVRFNTENKKRDHICNIFLMLGNDDFKANSQFLKENQERKGFSVIHNTCLPLFEDFKIIGYSFVPLTPFKYKDWEKLDADIEHETETRKGFVTEGIQTEGGKIVKKSFDLSERDDTIENDLKKLMELANPRKTILVTHSPPYNTKLDMIRSKDHVGSLAIRSIIEKNQPLISLHGHIHETVEVSGTFKEKIGKTLCLSAGNDHLNPQVHVISLDLYDTESAKRIAI